MFGSASGQSGVLFGNAQNQNLFGQQQPQQTGFFNTNSNISGTTLKYVPFNGTDTIQKNNTTVTVSTKLNCISAMKEYEIKSLEELRFEDYSVNRIYPQKSGIFGGNQANTGLFNTQQSMFQPNSPFGANQQNTLGGTNQTSLFGANNQTNAFGTKHLFGSTATSTNSAFGSFNTQSKPNTIFGTSTANKPLFGSTQSTQPTGLFGNTQVNTSPSLFTNQQQPQTGGFFGGLQSQQSQPTGLFNSNASTASFGFQPQQSTSLFGANTSKPFGTSNTSFSFSSSNTVTTPSLFGSTPQTGGLFSQNSTNPSFGSGAKTSLFSNANTFSTPTSSQTQPAQAFGQTTNIFGNQQKPNQTPFGATSVFSNNTQKTGLFGSNINTNTGFGTQNTSLFSTMGTSQPWGSTITTTTVAPPNTFSQINVTTPAEAAFQQQVMQQRILSLVSRPYGVNKLFMGQTLFGTESKPSSNPDSTSNNSPNLLSLAIKRSETDKFDISQRRKILNQKSKINSNQLYKVFSGFDDEEELSTKSNNVDQSFFTKREDWKYLPPDAFEKSHRSLLNINNNSQNKSGLNLSTEKPKNAQILTPSINIPFKFIKETDCSTPLNDYSLKKHEAIQVSPINNGRGSPHFISSVNKTRDSFLNDNSRFNESIRSNELKEELVTKSHKTDSSVGKLSFNTDKTQRSPLERLIDNNNVLNRSKNSDIDYQNNHANDDDDADDESINGDVDNIDLVSNSNKENCMVKLTKEGYYIAPKIEVLNQLVRDNECWVENFIIGRTGFGSIRFPGFTNVYGLNLDELVIIKSKEVTVYPDDDQKPEQGEGLNRLAQVHLQRVFPTDKSTGKEIKDSTRLAEMKFEERLKRSTERLGARFLKFTPENGLWVFEVDHFSKYNFIDSDDEELVEEKPKETKPIHRSITTKKEADSSKIDRIPRENESKRLKNSSVISAEADSLTNIDENQMIMFNPLTAIDKLLNCSNSRNLYKTKPSLYNNFDIEEETNNYGFFRGPLHNNNNSFRIDRNVLDKDQPKSKKFETCEMGEKIFISSLNNSKFDLNSDSHLMITEENDNRPIKPLVADCLAPTEAIGSGKKSIEHVYIPGHLRDHHTDMPYLLNRFKKYFDTIRIESYENYSNNVAIVQGNRFRVGIHMSCNPKFPGMKFFQINDKKAHQKLTPFNMFRRKIEPNSLVIMNCNYQISNYQEKMMESSLAVSDCTFSSNTKCPLWIPSSGLDVLKKYLCTHKEMAAVTSSEKTIFGRIFQLCEALWTDLIENNVHDNVPSCIQDLTRKQMLAKWIKMECREKLMTEIKVLFNSTSQTDIDKWNTAILHCLCSGEINLACQLAITTKQPRLALAISQSAGRLQGREIIREQLNFWVQSRTDMYISMNILSIYILLSGQTSLVLSDGSILTPFKDMWWVRALGIHFWYSQSYLGSIKTAVQSYDDSFKSEYDVASPFPIDVCSDSIEEIDENSESKYFDCCYHLIKLYCDHLYDLNVTLNPTTMSTQQVHSKLWDWSTSWHLSNFLTGMEFLKNIPEKVSQEWAAQLERGGNWTMAVFVCLHILDLQTRTNLAKNIIVRHVKDSRDLTEQEQFLVDKLRIPLEWIHEGKAIICKSTRNVELEAYHWLKAGQVDKSHQLYIDHIIPDLLINDKFERIRDILNQFLHYMINNQDEKLLVKWRAGGELYLKYIYIMTSLRTLKLTNKLANHSILLEYGGDCDFDIINRLEDKDEFGNQLSELKFEAIKLRTEVDGFCVATDAQRICKKQIMSVCDKFLQTCASELV